MTGTKKKPNEYVMCVVVLGAICLVIALALALVNNVTLPVITAAAAERAEQARIEVMPEADGFEELQLEGLPESVTQVYRATNGTGYVFMLKTKGYGGDMELICGINSSGIITQTKTLEHSETAGLGAKTAENNYRFQYKGKDSTLSGVDSITGATVSSKAYKGAIQDAFKAFAIAKEAE
jgi:electron transport complex protein RnfG